MPTRKTWMIYLSIFAVAAALAGWSFSLLDRAANVMGCRQLADRADAFLAYCEAPQFGDFEHGAYYYGLVPKAVEQLRQADLLILGGSRVQFAFSTDAIRRRFHEQSIRFYTLGFGYGEAYEFPLTLIKNENLAPKALIIDAGQFFIHHLSLPGYNVSDERRHFWRRFLAWYDYQFKMVFTEMQPGFCALMGAACMENYGAIYRSVADGTWIWRNVFQAPDTPARPIDGSSPQYYPTDQVADGQSCASELFKAAHVAHDCVILTAVPNSISDAEAYAIEMGRVLDVRVIVPHLEGLATIDGAHMTATSAERWSEAFLKKLGPDIQRCVAQ